MNKFIASILLFVVLFISFSCSGIEDNYLSVTPLPLTLDSSKTINNSPNVLSDSNNFIWGASVIKGADSKYHMFYSFWESGANFPKFSDGWLLLSKIGYAVSDYPDRDFKFQKVVLKGRIYDGDSSAWDAVSVHNPHIKKFNNKYYLYYTGSKDPGKQPVGSPGENLNKRNRIQQSQQIGIIEFENFSDLLNGNFTRPDMPILSPRTRVKPDNVVNPSPDGTVAKPDNIIVVNPSVVKRPSDGKYLLYFKGNLYDPQWKGVHGVALADSPLGPFKPMDNFVFDIKLDNGKLASAEDPYVWYHKKHRKFYSVFKDFSGKFTDGQPGLAILDSFDGINWHKPASPFFMRKELLLISGDTLKVSNLERPQLLIDNDGNPLVLYAACSIEPVGDKTDGSTFNVHIKLKSNN